MEVASIRDAVHVWVYLTLWGWLYGRLLTFACMVYRAFRTSQNKGAAAGLQATRCPESLGTNALVPRDQLGGGGVLERAS